MNVMKAPISDSQTGSKSTRRTNQNLSEKELMIRVDRHLQKKQQRLIDKMLLEAYGRKRKLLKLSFWQGVLFGLGSAIGGTLVLALLIWLLARVVDWFPILGDVINKIIEHTARR